MSYILKSKYVSVWDCGTTLESDCKFDYEKKECFDIKQQYDVNVDILIDEYVILPDGTEERNFELID